MLAPGLSERRAERLSSNNAIIVACGAATTVGYLVRSMLSVVILEMSREHGWSHQAEGAILSAFFYGYICTNLLGGVLCRKVGAKPVLAGSVLGFSVLTLLLPTAAAVSLRALWWARVATGVCQGPMYACVFHVYGRIPTEQRARAVSAANAGAPLGIALSFFCGPLIESLLGWPAALRAAGLAGIPWLLLWMRMTVDPPHTEVVGPGAQSHGKDDSSAGGCSALASTAAQIPWRQIVTEPRFLVIALAHFAYAWGNYTMLAWLPTYFSMALGVSEKNLSVTAVPYVMMVVCTLCCGMVSDNLLKSGLGLLRVRRTMTVYAPAAHLTHGLHCSEAPCGCHQAGLRADGRGADALRHGAVSLGQSAAAHRSDGALHGRVRRRALQPPRHLDPALRHPFWRDQHLRDDHGHLRRADHRQSDRDGL